MMKKLILSSFFVFSFAGLSLAQAPVDNSCLQCHSDYWEDMKASVHSKEGITCNQCHGGDPSQSAQELAHSAEKGYIGVPDKKQIAQLCGTCHADVERMNFYGIPTDQLAQYKTSHHGKALFEKDDAKVAVCSDCHGYHDVVSVKDINSPVYPSNIVKTCGKCHGNEKLMSSRNLPSDIPDKYTHSVHGKALFEKGDTGVAQCVSCHGSHGAMPPKVKSVDQTCGKCHINERKYFLESVHARLSDEKKFPECIACHGNHEVKPATLGLYEEMCLKCHQWGDSAMGQGTQMLKMLMSSEHMVELVSKVIKQAGIEGFFVEPEEAQLEECKTMLIELRPLQHTLDIERIEKLHQQLKDKVEQINKSIDEKRSNLMWRKVALIFVWIFIFIMITALWKRYKQYTHPS